MRPRNDQSGAMRNMRPASGSFSSQNNMQQMQQMRPSNEQLAQAVSAPAIGVSSSAMLQRRNLLLDLPIAWRLALGFLVAALIAAAASGVPALQRAQALTAQSNFYQDLLQSNTHLSSGDLYIQNMFIKLQSTYADATVASPSRETLAEDQTALADLANRYDTLITLYIRNELVADHPYQVGLLTEANHSNQVDTQRILAGSALRAWQFYRAAQEQILQDIASGTPSALNDANILILAQGQPTNADAQSALRTLIQFNVRVANSVHDAADVEQQFQIITALIAGALAFALIALVGWVISNTLVRRLSDLRRVTQLVEQGEVTTRVRVVGRDEIGNVSASVNGMLDTIVGLLDVTRRQRDALTNAAERLFTDVRVAGAGDLRVNAAVSSDPIGMLANAFNFTIGRFRRFVLRTQTMVDQLDIIGRQELERAETFLTSAQGYVRGASAPSQIPNQPGGAAFRNPRSGFGLVEGSLAAGPDSQFNAGHDGPALAPQVERVREQVRNIARDGSSARARTALDLAEQAYLSAGKISQLTMTIASQRTSTAQDSLFQNQLDELRTLGGLLTQLGRETQTIQQTTGAGLAELDATLASLAGSARTLSTAPLTAGGSTGMSSAQALDLVRLSSSFAQDIAALARQITILTQEMRSGVAPFRIDAAESSASIMYPPGSGPMGPMGAMGGEAGFDMFSGMGQDSPMGQMPFPSQSTNYADPRQGYGANFSNPQHSNPRR